jgi:6-pyruvoyltetrahydropterin/6-carboxytetrahydropterin synthase
MKSLKIKKGPLMEWTLEKEFRFEASHVLPRHGGKCARLHGHSWRGRLVCRGTALQSTGPSVGMVLDYGELSAAIRPLLDQFLDHYHLNDSLQLENPTSEEVARWIFDRVKPVVPQLTQVVLDETCTSRCVYAESGKF